MVLSEQVGVGRSVAVVDYTVLGSVVVNDGIDQLSLGGPKQRAVLAVLIANVGRVVTAETLVQAVYGDDAPSRRRRTISTYISTLRAAVGDDIVKQGAGWTLSVDPSLIDAARFEQLVDAAKALAPEAAADLLREALELWQGHAYSDIEANGYLDAEIARLDELRLTALEARTEADLALGRHNDLVAELAALLAEYPYREHFRAQHMLALYRGGRQREALASYQEMRTLLVEELGADPNPDLQELERRIIAQDSALNLAPARLIQRRAVAVFDLGDPLGLGGTSRFGRDERLSRMTSVLQAVAEQNGNGETHLAGAARYLVFDSAHAAVAAGRAASGQLDGTDVRIAIDWGDVEVNDQGVTGPPVSRSAALVSAAHPGQVLLSSEAHDEVIHGGDSTGMRFESLGAHRLAGVEAPTHVLQLLIGDPPRTFPALDPSRLPPALPAGRHRSIPGYELREVLGDGSVGILYRAYQPSVGREVIIEVIERAVASNTDFICHFEADAQRLALLDHPHINPLLDYWREPDGAYLVYRNRRGGLLDNGADASGALLEQIGSALRYAHSYGIAHGSVRPDRILLDESGFGYLMGFPVGKLAPRSSPKHAAYIAPETLTGAEPSVAADIYGLGVLGHAIESGLGDADRPLVPKEGALVRALSEDPGDRQASVHELMAALTPTTVGATSHYTDLRNPYKGLAAFHASDAADFFGRSALTATLVDALQNSHFLAVVGPSGVGKSSVVRAGVVPAVRNGALNDSATWVVTDMLPGAHPFHELRRALERVVVHLPPSVVEGLVHRDAGALEDVARGLPDRAKLLIVIDQFEELFTLCEQSVARYFVDLLVAIVESQLAHIVITLRADFLDRPLQYSAFGDLVGEHLVTVATPNRDELAEAIIGPAESVGLAVDPDLVERICAEVHDRPGALPLLQHALAELFTARTTDRLTLEDYEAIGGVTGSLERRAEAILAGLDRELQPLAQRTMLRLVTVIDDGAPMRRRIRMGQLDDLEAQVIEAFVGARLLVNDIEPDTRTPTIEVAHEALLTHWPRLNGWIESHRSELTLHHRLAEAAVEWRAAERDPAMLLTGGRLAQHETWVQHSDLAPSDIEQELLTQSRSAARHRDTSQKRGRTMIMSGFAAAAIIAGIFATAALVASRRADDRRADAEQAEANALTEADRADTNAAQAEANAAAAKANESRADVAAAEASTNADLAAAAAREADQQRQSAEGRALLASVAGASEQDPQLALLLSISAADRLGDQPAALSALHDTIAAQRTVYETEWTGDLINGFEVEGDLSADGRLLAVVGPAGNTVELHDVDRGTLLWVHEFDVERPLEHKVMAQFIGQGDELMVGLSWHPAPERAFDTPSPLIGFHVLNSATGETVRRYDSGPCGPVGKRVTQWGGLGEAAESSTLAFGVSQGWFDLFGCASADPAAGAAAPYPEIDVMRVDLATGVSTPILSGWDGGAIVVAMSGDGRRAALREARSSQDTFTIVDVDSGDILNVVANDTNWPGLILNHDGSTVGAGGATEGAGRLFDVESGALVRTYPDLERGSRLSGGWVSADGNRFLVSDVAGSLTVHDSGTGELLTIIPSDAPIGLVRMTPDLRRVATFGSEFDRTVRVSALSGGVDEVASFDPCQEAGLERAFFLNRGLTVQGQLLTVMAFCDPIENADDDLPNVTFDGAARSPARAYTYSLNNGELLATHQAFGQNIAVTNSGTAAMQRWTQTADGTYIGGDMVLVDLATGEILETLDGVCSLELEVYRLAEDPIACDGTGVAIEGQHVDMSPDGTVVALSSSREPTLGRAWNLATGASTDLAAPIGALGISPDGSTLAVVQQFEPSQGGLGKLQLYSTDDFTLVAESAPLAALVRGGVEFSPDGKTLAVISGDPGNAIRFYDADTLALLKPLSEPHELFVMGFAFSADGTSIATVGADGSARVWNVDTLTLAHEIDIGGFVTAATFLDDDRQLAVATRSEGVKIYYLELEDLVDEARTRATRGYTSTECSVYFPDSDCPTLDDLLGP